jgi:hypothetical protein
LGTERQSQKARALLRAMTQGRAEVMPLKVVNVIWTAPTSALKEEWFKLRIVDGGWHDREPLHSRNVTRKY